MIKFLLRIALVIVGFAVGAIAGGYLTFYLYDKNHPGVRAFAMTGMFAAVSEGEYDRKGSDAKIELLTLIEAYSSALNSSAISKPVKNAFLFNRGLTEARLSVIHSEEGNSDQAKTYLSKAGVDLKAVGWVDVSDTIILRAAKRQLPCAAASQTVAKASSATLQKPCG